MKYGDAGVFAQDRINDVIDRASWAACTAARGQDGRADYGRIDTLGLSWRLQPRIWSDVHAHTADPRRRSCR